MIPIRNIKWLILALALVTGGCYYDNEEDLYGAGSCIPNAAPSFSVDVLPILDARCNNCHSGASPSAGIKLDSYNEVIKYVSNGKLMGSINHASGYSAMPKNGSKLSACQIQLIQTWIATDAPNN